MAELEHRLAGSVTLLVGQSGVGKSSLVNALSPEAAAQTAELTRDFEGRHTTTTARWYPLGKIRRLSMRPGSAISRRRQASCAQPSGVSSRSTSCSVDCRFKDCRHMEEPGCAVRTAVVNQQISPRRYESYRR